MAYEKTNWQDTLRDGQGNVIQKGTPLNAQALGKIEDGIIQAEQKIDNEISQVTTQLAETAIHLSSFPRIVPESDDTARVQRAIDYAATNRLNILGTEEYTVNSIRIKNGVKSFIVNGRIKGKGTSQNGIVQIDGGSKFGGQTVEGCTVSVNLDMSAGDTMGIYADGSLNCVIEHCKIDGFTDDTNKKYGIYLHHNSRGNIVRNNIVKGSLKPTGAYQFMIIAIGETLAWGGYFDGSGGTVSRATKPVLENQIYNNTCLNGTHGVVLNGAEKSIVTNNVCKYNSHRAIVLEPVCFENLVSNNQLIGYGSAAVIVAYGSNNNLIANNECFDGDLTIMPADGEGSITVYVGSKDNKLIGNKINSQRRYGIYLACDVKDNVVENNDVAGYRLAAVAIESDWIPSGADPMNRGTLPTDAKYSRPNYGTPPTNSTGVQSLKWAFGNAERNVVQNNTLSPGSAASTAIYLAQMGDTTSLQNNVVQNNTVKDMPTGYHYLYVFEELANKIVNNTLKNNNFLGGTSVTIAKFWMSRWRNHFNSQSGNTFIDTIKINFPNGDTAPSVKYGGEFWFANAAATSVTNFTDGVDGQEILVRLDANTTLVHSSASLRLKGNVNVTTANANQFIRFRNFTGIWFEMYRNF